MPKQNVKLFVEAIDKFKSAAFDLNVALGGGLEKMNLDPEFSDPKVEKTWLKLAEKYIGNESNAATAQ